MAFSRLIVLASLAVSALASASTAPALNGLWDGTVTVNGIDVPFRFEVVQDGGEIKGSFFNGEERVTSTSGQFTGGVLTLRYAYYAGTLTATLKDEALEGKYDRGKRGVFPFKAVRHHSEESAAGGPVPSIAGSWEVEVKSGKGEAAWRFLVRQNGPDVSAAILRVDGDTGTLTGRFRDGKLLLSHFSGARPMLLEVTPKADGKMDLVQNGTTPMTAVRAADARRQNLPAPTDPAQHTTVRNPQEPLQFQARDLNGNWVTQADPRFRGKVVIVSVGGSWCPNCHDEAPFLVELYQRFHDQGLEILLLSFEEADQLADPARVRAFVKQYGIPYPVLLAGEPGELNAKLPQAVNLNAWPTTFFIGRDGLVRSVHAGFAGRATGELHTQLKREVTELVGQLLAERVRSAGDGTMPSRSSR